MNFPATDQALITRREAIKRASLLLGTALSPSILAGVMEAQPAERGGKAAMQFLDEQQFVMAAAIAERILPRTETPGAADVGVPAFIDVMYGRYLTLDEKQMLTQGLADANVVSMARQGKRLVDLTPGQQDEVLRGIARASQGKEKSFFQLIRELTLVGYFTSEPIGRDVLHYDPIPGPYQACLPLAAVGNRAWTR